MVYIEATEPRPDVYMDFTESYRHVKKKGGNKFRSALRHITLTGLSSLEYLYNHEHHLNKPRVQFLYFHHVFKDEEDKLSSLLDLLSRQYTYISYLEAAEKALNGQIDKPYLTFSFDDGFRNNLRAAHILNTYNAKACFFINPAVIGEKNPSVIQHYCRTKLNFPPVEFLSWDEVGQLLRWGHEIGGHTHNHINMALASPNAIADDLEQSTAILKARCGDIKHFAFPYGRFQHFSAAARKAVFASGYHTCASVIRGCHFPHTLKIEKQQFNILRDHVILDWPQSHIMYFLMRNARKNEFDYSYPY